MSLLDQSLNPRDDRPAPLPIDREGSAADQPLFRFGLRQLLLFVAGICGVLAMMALAGGMNALLILLAAVIVMMHVFATALGTRLQAQTQREQLLQRAKLATERPDSVALQPASDLAAIRSAPRSPWHGRGCTYLPWLPKIVIGSMTAGALIGIVLLNGMIGHRTSAEGIVVGAASFAVLGGWISFLVVSFYGVFSHGFREALAEQMKDQPGPSANQ